MFDIRKLIPRRAEKSGQLTVSDTSASPSKWTFSHGDQDTPHEEILARLAWVFSKKTRDGSRRGRKEVYKGLFGQEEYYSTEKEAMTIKAICGLCAFGSHYNPGKGIHSSWAPPRNEGAEGYAFKQMLGAGYFSESDTGIGVNVTEKLLSTISAHFDKNWKCLALHGFIFGVFWGQGGRGHLKTFGMINSNYPGATEAPLPGGQG